MKEAVRMDCQEAQDALNKAHGFEKIKYVDPDKFLLVLDHVGSCPGCKAWAKSELCPKVKAKNDKGELSEDVYMLHGMLHGDGAIGGDCAAHS